MQIPLAAKVFAYRLGHAAQAGLACAARRLPGAWGWLGLPTGSSPSLRAWVERARAKAPDRWARTTGPHYEVLEGPVMVRRPAPLSLPGAAVPHELTIDRHTAHPELFLAVLPDARVLGPEGVVVTSDGRVVAESTWPRRRLPRARVWTALRLPACSRVSGRVYTIASPEAGGYYHWVTEVLPRLSALQTLPAGDSPVLLSSPPTPWQADSLRRLGIAEDRWLPLKDRCVRAEVLLLPSFLGDPSPHPTACRWLRERLLPAAGSPPGHRRLYVTRRIARCRRVMNEKDLEPLLRDYGFEVVEAERLTFGEQVALFSQAAVVAGPHGAGLTNALFAPPTCRVLELFQPGYVLASTYKIATCLGQPYWYLVGRPGPGGDSPNTQDMVIDRDRLAACLAAVCA